MRMIYFVRFVSKSVQATLFFINYGNDWIAIILQWKMHKPQWLLLEIPFETPKKGKVNKFFKVLHN